MGVRGLMTYLRNNKETFFKPYELKNKIVVFDGQYIAHWIIEHPQSDIDLQFSGDNDVYYTRVREYFEDFLCCGITPVVVMNGPFPEIDAPKRVEDGIQEILRRDEPASRLPPMIFKTAIFVQVLRDLKINYYCSDGDSHKDVARQAQKHNCPVISFDSDFFIYDVPFIPVKFDLSLVEQKKCISCLIFDREKFMETLGLNLQTLPVVATAIGNDFAEWELSDYFYDKAGLRCYQGGKFNNTYVKIPATIEIFKGLETKSAAANKFLSYFSSEEMRIQAREAVKKSMEYYDSEFEDDVTDMIPVSDRIKGLLKTGHISSTVAGLIRRNDFLFTVSSFEDSNKPSMADFCWDLLVGIYTFLQRENENKLETTVYFRNGLQVGRKELSVSDSLGIKPGEMTVAERQAAFYKAADLDRKDIMVMKMFPRSWQLFIAALQFWSKKMRTDKDFRSYHFHAIFLNVFVVIARRIALSENEAVVSNESDGDIVTNNLIRDELSIIEASEAGELWPLYETLRKPRQGKNRSTLHRESCDTHFERCLLTIMEYLNDLSFVMGTTFEPIRYEKFVNGSIVYSLMESLKSSDNVRKSALELLSPSTRIKDFYEFLCSILQGYIPREDITEKYESAFFNTGLVSICVGFLLIQFLSDILR